MRLSPWHGAGEPRVFQARCAGCKAGEEAVGGNINAPVIVIAETEAADRIRGREPLAPVNVRPRRFNIRDGW